jgi:hypothetical protein
MILVVARNHGSTVVRAIATCKLLNGLGHGRPSRPDALASSSPALSPVDDRASLEQESRHAGPLKDNEMVESIDAGVPRGVVASIAP